jgi:D-alanyl-D-alanine dipeptidase
MIFKNIILVFSLLALVFLTTSQTNKSSNTKKIRKGFEKLVDVQTLDSSIQVDLKYATTDNFMKKRLYFDIDKAYLQKGIAQRLVKCNTYLKTLQPNYRLLIYDAARPRSIQQAMWEALDTIPVKERTKFVSNPTNGSVHNYAAAVDVTICDRNGKAVDMGAGYDDIRLIAYPSKEDYFFQKGLLSKKQLANRRLLRKVMTSQGFKNITTEWWHFNGVSRKEAKAQFAILE